MTWVDTMLLGFGSLGFGSLGIGWLGIGVATGVAHALGIWHSVTHQRVTSALFGLIRLVIIAGVLIVSAVLGGLIPTALGWIVGFFVTVAIIFILKGSVAVRRPEGRRRISP